MFDEGEEQGPYYSFEKLWATVRRGRWWILLPLFLCWITVWSISWLLPPTYMSEASILVEQQKVPEQYVVPNVSVGVHQRLQSMTQQILSRTRLQETIDRYHLYSSGRGLEAFLQSGDPVEQMRKDIKIDLVEAQGRPEDPTAFRISYSAGSPELAQEVNQDLTTLFIEESVKAQQQLSQSTTSFLDNQVEEARKNLAEQETKVRAFKAKHFGDLPSQLQSNVEILSGLQAQLQSVQHALDTAKQQKLYLDSQLQQLQTAQRALGGGGSPSELEELQKQLLDLQSRLTEERAQHTDDHPDSVSLKAKITEKEKQIQDLDSKANSKSKQDSIASTPVDSGPGLSSAPLMQVRSQLKSNELEIQNYQRQEKNIEEQIASYQARLNLTPETEQELADVSRGYEESKANYNSLLQKKNQSQLATNLEQRQQGQQFRLLDPPSFPVKPKAPNHLFLSFGGLALGCVIGSCLLALREVTNDRVRCEEDLAGIVQARVLAHIPHLYAPREGRLQAQSRLLETAAVSAMVLLILLGNLYAFYKG